MQVAVAQPEVLFSRYEDGARPVKVLSEGWEVLGPDGSTRVHKTAQALLADLTGHPEGRHWSIDRYFGLGRHAPKLIGQANIFDLFQPREDPTPVVLPALAPSIVTLRSTFDISIPRENLRRGKNLDSRRSRFSRTHSPVEVSGPVGIDLANRAHEVKKLLFAGFGRRIFAAGYDPEDVLQEVYRGILARNAGKCPWDPAKSSFGHYVHMVIGCVLSNYHRKQKRVGEFEQSGIRSYQPDGEYKHGDAASAQVPASPTPEHQCSMQNEVVDDLAHFILSSARGESMDAKLAVEIIPYVSEGVPRAEIARSFGVSMAAVSRAVSYLRKQALDWRLSLQ